MAPQTTKKNKHLFLLLGILAVSFCFKLTSLGAPSIKGDEGYSFYEASKPIPEMIDSIKGDPHPPGYYLFLHFWQLLGKSEFWLRLSSVLFHAGAVVMAYLLGKLLFSPRTGILAAGILAVSEAHLRYSQLLRMYSLIVLISLVAVYFFFKFLKRQSLLNAALFVLFSAAGLYTHYYFIFLLLALHCYVLLMKVQRKFWKAWILANLAILLLFLPWLPIFSAQVSIKTTLEQVTYTLDPNAKVSWLSPDTSNIFVRMLMIFFHLSAGYLKVNLHSPVFLACFLASIVLFPFLLCKALLCKAFTSHRNPGSWRFSFLRKRDTRLALLALLLLVPSTALLLLWGFSILTPQTYARHLLLISPFYYLILAAGIDRLKKPLLYAALTLIILLNLVSAYNYFQEDYSRENWREAVTFIQPKSGNEAIILAAESYIHDFNYYYTGHAPVYGAFTGWNETAYEHFDQLGMFKALRPITPQNACTFLNLTAGYDAVWLVQLGSSADEPTLSLQRTCVAHELSLKSQLRNYWRDMYGNTDYDLQVYEYRKAKESEGGFP
ncbi:MAG: glycosyltransferase family 39 protein [Nanoarchaeota archaeon]